NNSVDGIYMSGGSTNVSSSLISGNPTYGFYHTGSPTSSAVAQNNYWGAASGPAPIGSGDKVSSYVDYTNWLTSWP
ncbi:MAG: hypothetical protein Q8P49_00715, partial [Candidatus Liptonbacteria bacterium]|nr:hypothetical protein [Candidatus Liptonbacteria bacterium]